MYGAFSSSVACMYFFIKASRPLPSPFPGSTSLLCSSAYMAKALLGLLGSSRRFRALFSLALTCWRSCKYCVYFTSLLKSNSFWSYSSLSLLDCFRYSSFFSSSTFTHSSATFLPSSPAPRPLFCSTTLAMTSDLKRAKAEGAFLGASSSLVLINFFCICLLSIFAFSVQKFAQSVPFLYSTISTSNFFFISADWAAYSAFFSSLSAPHSSEIFLPMSPMPPPASITSFCTRSRISPAKSM
mmetsp:Transcript_68945/g.214008  ORF Transcript_68945/g.214008 Transcript_68945/m.214008 type:complete len:241 (-) Transcript_68945:322-1044(-)